MSTSTSVLFDDLGPRGRRQVQVVSVLVSILIAVCAFVAIRRFGDNGQLRQDLWETLTKWPNIRFLLLGALHTLQAAALAMLLALIVGALMALGRLARGRIVRWSAGIYVETFRAVPLLLLILFAYLALPKYGIDISPFFALVLGLTLYNGAMLGEIFRAGILSLDRGQSEAASSIGLSYWQSMIYVVIPQAGRRMIPGIISQLVALLKDTALGYVVTYDELLRRSQSLGLYPPYPLLQAFLAAAFLYFLVNFTLSRIARRLEVRQRRRYRASPMDVTGAEELAINAAQGTR